MNLTLLGLFTSGESRNLLVDILHQKLLTSVHRIYTAVILVDRQFTDKVTSEILHRSFVSLNCIISTEDLVRLIQGK